MSSAAEKYCCRPHACAVCPYPQPCGPQTLRHTGTTSHFEEMPDEEDVLASDDLEMALEKLTGIAL